MRIVYCGVGALGSHAVLMCRNLAATLVLVDCEQVASENLPAQGFVKLSVGKNRAEAMKAQLADFYDIQAEAHGVRVTEQNTEGLLGNADLIVDCFDDLRSRAVLSAFAVARGKPLVHGVLAADGTFGLVRWEEHFAPDAADDEGNPSCAGGEHLPLVGLVAAALARSVQDFATAGERHDYIVSLNGAQRV